MAKGKKCLHVLGYQVPALISRAGTCYGRASAGVGCACPR